MCAYECVEERKKICAEIKLYSCSTEISTKKNGTDSLLKASDRK